MKDREDDVRMMTMSLKDLELAASVLDAILENGDDQGKLLVTLRQMAKTLGGVQVVAKAAKLSPTHIYRILSKEGNPELRSLNALLHTMGLRLSVRPLANPAMHV